MLGQIDGLCNEGAGARPGKELDWPGAGLDWPGAELYWPGAGLDWQGVRARVEWELG